VGPLEVDPLTMLQVLDAIDRLVSAGRGGSVFTPNTDHVVNAQADRAFREAYESASLSLADGMPVVWAARLLGTPLPERVAGSDLCLPLLERAAARGWRVFLTGGAPGVADEAVRRLSARLPSLRIVGTDAPRISLVRAPGDLRADDAVRHVRAARPDLVLVGFGSPKQELWIHRNAEALRPVVAVAVGAGIDFLAGTARRAPRWMARVGLEWAWRLAREPRRLWRRYLVNDPKFLAILARQLLTGRAR